jgi:hypothetical protein
MVNNLIYEAIDSLAERHIPKTKHKFLHVNSRKAWRDMMLVLLETNVIKPKLSLITKCALNWEELLYKRACMYN